jgi:AmmeMemoRadiSam system protein B
VIVASTDLSHYQPAARAADLDARVTECVCALDAAALMARLDAYRGHACGGGALAAAMKAARALGATRGEVLRYADSGDVEGGDKSRVVGYMAAAFTAPAPA